MRIQYTNPYRTAQTFLLRTDRPDLLRFEVRAIILSGFSLGVFVKTDGCALQEERLEIPPGQGRHMYLHFEMQPPGTVALVRSCPHPYMFSSGPANHGRLGADVHLHQRFGGQSRRVH